MQGEWTVEWTEEEDQIHTLPYCHWNLKNFQRDRCSIFSGWRISAAPCVEGISCDKTSQPQLRVWRKWGLFIPPLTAKVQASSSKRKSHFPNASYHLSNSFSCSQEASHATIYVTSATDFLVVEYRWNKTLFYNKHSKILHRISIVYNPEPVTLNKTLLTNISAASQCPIMSTVP